MSDFISDISKIIIACTCLIIAGCNLPEKPTLSNTEIINDPHEGWNRGVFAFNTGVDEYALEPLSNVYGTVIPKTVRLLVNHELDYLQSPISLVNSLFQADTGVIKHVFARFLINTTIGGLGLLDPATEMGFPAHQEDFGQTLAVWGVGEGFYYMTPFLGSLTFRDVGGKFIDIPLDPSTYVGENFMMNIGKTAVKAIEFREQNKDTINGLKSSSEDYYAVVRNFYLQKRNAEIMNQDLQPTDDFINFSE